MAARNCSSPQDFGISKMKHEYISKSEEETVQLGMRLARLLNKGDIICLFGELGAGKTIFTKGIAKGLNIDSKDIISPTFVLLNEYRGRWPLYHFDLYRLEDPQQILAIGYEEFFFGNGVTVVEWADRLKTLLPKEYLAVQFSFHNCVACYLASTRV